MSKAQKGRILSEETRRKISESKKGKKHAKISEFKRKQFYETTNNESETSDEKTNNEA